MNFFGMRERPSAICTALFPANNADTNFMSKFAKTFLLNSLLQKLFNILRRSVEFHNFWKRFRLLTNLSSNFLFSVKSKEDGG